MFDGILLAMVICSTSVMSCGVQSPDSNRDREAKTELKAVAVDPSRSAAIKKLLEDPAVQSGYREYRSRGGELSDIDFALAWSIVRPRAPDSAKTEKPSNRYVADFPKGSYPVYVGYWFDQPTQSYTSFWHDPASGNYTCRKWDPPTRTWHPISNDATPPGYFAFNQRNSPEATKAERRLVDFPNFMPKSDPIYLGHWYDSIQQSYTGYFYDRTMGTYRVGSSSTHLNRLNDMGPSQITRP